MLFFPSIARPEETPRFLEWADSHLAKQREDFRNRFATALLGLHAIANGGRFDTEGFDHATGGRRFLGWTLERHWLLPERRKVATRSEGGIATP